MDKSSTNETNQNPQYNEILSLRYLRVLYSKEHCKT